MMIDTKLRHPHAYTLDLLSQVIDRLPPIFSDEAKNAWREKLTSYSRNFDVPYQTLHKSIVNLGHESWPYRRAYDELYERYGRFSEETHLLQILDKGLRDKFGQFIEDGGKLNRVLHATVNSNFKAPAKFEHYFTAEEKHILGLALVDVRVQAHKEIDELVLGARRDDYLSLVEKYSIEQQQIESKLATLSGMAALSVRFSDEIQQRLLAFKEGWSVIERNINLVDVEAEIEYWQGAMVTFLSPANA